jgi:hypothetical protein
MRNPLYELADDLLALTDDGEDFPLDDEGAKRLAGMTPPLEAFEARVEDYAKTVKCLEADRDACKTEAARLTERARVFNNRIDWLKSYVSGQMQRLKIDKIKGAVLTASLRKCPPSCMVVDSDKIPPAFMVDHEPTPDKKGILVHFKDTGEIVDGVDIVMDKKSLNIR